MCTYIYIIYIYTYICMCQYTHMCTIIQSIPPAVAFFETLFPARNSSSPFPMHECFRSRHFCRFGGETKEQFLTVREQKLASSNSCIKITMSKSVVFLLLGESRPCCPGKQHPAACFVVICTACWAKRHRDPCNTSPFHHGGHRCSCGRILTVCTNRTSLHLWRSREKMTIHCNQGRECSDPFCAYILQLF